MFACVSALLYFFGFVVVLGDTLFKIGVKKSHCLWSHPQSHHDMLPTFATNSFTVGVCCTLSHAETSAQKSHYAKKKMSPIASRMVHNENGNKLGSDKQHSE